MMLGLTREDWNAIADLVRRADDDRLLAKIGEDGKRAHDASTRLFLATREALRWWEDSYSTVGCDQEYIDRKIVSECDADTLRVVKKLRIAVQTAHGAGQPAESESISVQT